MQALKGFIFKHFFYFTYFPVILGIATAGLFFEQAVPHP
jgi:hypothetical protein